MGDYFFKAMLQDALTNGGGSVPLSSLDISLLKLDDANVMAEYTIPDEVSKNKRPDIIITDISNKLIVIVEHKYGSREHNNQLAEYSNWAESILSGQPDYRLIRIHLDIYGPYDRDKLVKCERDKWSLISYDWLIKALDNAVTAQLAKPEISYILKDLLIHLDGKYELDSTYAKALKVLADMAHDHSQLIKDFKFIDVELTDGSSLNLFECDDIDIILLQSQFQPADTPAITQVHRFLARNKTLLYSLAEYAYFECIQEKLEKKHPGHYEIECYSGQEPGIGIFLTSWQKHRQQTPGLWPLYVRVTESAGEESKYQLSVIMQRQGWNDEGLAINLTKHFGINLIANWQTKTLIKYSFDKASTTPDILIGEIQAALDKVNAAVRK